MKEARNNTSPATSASSAELCVVDRSCTPTGCDGATTDHTTPHDATPRRKRFRRAGMVGLLCVLGCATAPLAIGGVTGVIGALSGETWMVAAGLLIAVLVFAHGRRTGQRRC